SDYVWRTRFQTTAATDIPISFIYAAMPVGFVLVLVHLAFIARRYVVQGEYVAEEEMDGDAASSI
ncbi:MAG: TRAP transporter small permease, partial [Comamonas sp.]